MWARNNSDKLCQPCGSGFNAIHNIEDITGSGTITEPVTLQQAKDYLRLEGFQPDDDSPADEFDFDDALVTSEIIAARLWVEKYTGVHIVPKTLQVTLTNGVGMMAIPGPVTGTITWKDKDGGSIPAARLIGSLFPKIESETCERQVLEYEAGYGTDCPDWAKNAIKAYVAWAYENRGDATPNRFTEFTSESPDKAAAFCRPYRRVKIFG